MNKRKLVNAFLQAAEGSAKKAAAKNITGVFLVKPV